MEQTLPTTKLPTYRGQTVVPLTSNITKRNVSTETTVASTVSSSVSGLRGASMSTESSASTAVSNASIIVKKKPTHTTLSRTMVSFTSDVTSSTLIQRHTVQPNESTTIDNTPTCEPNFSNTSTNKSYHVDCSGFDISVGLNAVHTIYPFDSANNPVLVNCVSTSDGVWTAIQRRVNGLVDFYRGWNDYKEGFGAACSEYWIGNDAIYQLTSRSRYKLKVVLKDWNNVTAYANYDTFRISAESDGYRLNVGGYYGDAGDSTRLSMGQKFSTPDRDNDGNSDFFCADIGKGGWWYSACSNSNLNGLYFNESNAMNRINGIRWVTFSYESLQEATMMIRKV